MEFLIKVFLFISLLSSVTGAKTLKIKCSSGQEFTQTLEFLNKQDKTFISQIDTLKIATEVAQNCSGSSLKFQKLFNTLIQTGVDQSYALKFAVKYSIQSEESVAAFLSLYEGLVVEKKFNMAFYDAFTLAEKFALKSNLNKEVLKKDFLTFLDFCVNDQKGPNLSLDTCRKISLKYIELQPLFSDGAAEEFKTLFNFLKENKNTGLSIAKSLSLTQEVLEKGPGSSKNFINTYTYLSENTHYKPLDILKIALKVASFTQILVDE